MAHKQTELARQRTQLAHERTVLAYYRTAAALVLFGLGFIGFGMNSNVLVYTGWISLCLGIFFFAVAVARGYTTQKEIARITKWLSRLVRK